MVKVADARNIAQGPSLRDPGVRVPDAGAGVGQALSRVGAQLQTEAREQERKEEEVKRKEQRVEDLRFLTAYEEAHREQAGAISEEYKNREADADYVPGVSERGAGLHRSVMSSFGSRYAPSEYAIAQAERLHSRMYTNMRVNARANHNRAAVAEALMGAEGGMDKAALAVASAPDLEVLQGAYDEIDEKAALLVGDVDPAKLEELRQEKREDATVNYFLGLLQEEELDAAEQQLRSGDFDDDLGDGTRKSALLNQIKTTRDAIARAAAAAFEKAHTAAEQTVALGLMPDASDMEAAVQKMPRGTRGAARARLEALTTIATQYDAFGAAPRGTRESVLADAQARLDQSSAVTPAQRLRFQALTRIHERATEQEKTDATVLVAGNLGVPAVDPSIPADISNPDYAEQSQALADATTQALGIGPEVQTLPKAAYDQVVEGLDSAEESKRNAALIYLSGLESDTRTNVLDTLGDKVRPAVRIAISVAGEDSDLALAISRGDLLRSQQGGTAGRIMPKNDQVSDRVAAKFGTALRDLPAKQQDLVQAALSLYALEAGGDDPKDEQIDAILDRLVPELLLPEINNEKVLLPAHRAGFNEATMQAAIDRAVGIPVGYVANRAVPLPEGATDEPPEDFAENVGVAYNPVTGQPLNESGFRMVAIIDAEGERLTVDEVRKLKLREQVAPGVYAAYTDSSTTAQPAPVRVLYESEDGMVQRTAGFALSTDKMSRIRGPQGARLAPRERTDMPEPLEPAERMEVERTWGEALQKFTEKNRQFGERVESNYAKMQENLKGRFNPDPEPAPPGPPEDERPRDVSQTDAVRDFNELQLLAAGSAEYEEKMGMILRKYGGYDAFNALLEGTGASQ